MFSGTLCCGNCCAVRLMYTIPSVLTATLQSSSHFTESKTESQSSALGSAHAAGKYQNQHSNPGLSGLEAGTKLLNLADLTALPVYENNGASQNRLEDSIKRRLQGVCSFVKIK